MPAVRGSRCAIHSLSSASACSWAITYLVIGDDNLTELALGLVFCAVLVTITLTDLEQRLIPNKIVLAGALAGVAIALTDPSNLDERAIAAAAAGGFLLVVTLLYPRGMGMGDVKLAAMMGLYLGRAVAPALLIGFAAGALVGLAMMARHGVGGAQARDPIRALPGAGRDRRALGRRRDRRLVHRHVFLRLTIELGPRRGAGAQVHAQVIDAGCRLSL